MVHQGTLEIMPKDYPIGYPMYTPSKIITPQITGEKDIMNDNFEPAHKFTTGEPFECKVCGNYHQYCIWCGERDDNTGHEEK